jgi:uncharacterized small protein (DUF1192 family)
MDAEDLEPLTKKVTPRDLTLMSIEDLDEYIEVLKAEIERAEGAIQKKHGARHGAESFFKS